MRIGVIGAGQLGRMLALAGYPLGLRFVFLDQSADAPGAQVGRIIRGAFDDVARLQELAADVDIVTFDVHIGNFVEVKNATLGRGAKANHLAYLGDSVVGERVNYGAGSITANYDGANKHKTVIGADVHVGSNCVLVAPVTIGEGGTVGAGSVVTKDTPAGALTVSRARQVSLPDWQRPAKGAK